MRGLRGLAGDVPDLVLRPRDEADVAAVLDWAGEVGAPVVPFGGGTSVVGGVEPRGLDRAVSLDLSLLTDWSRSMPPRVPSGCAVGRSARPPERPGARRSCGPPYLRESLVLLGVLVETFETAVTWDRFDDLVARVTEAVTDALLRVCGGGRVTCRLTHVYADGAAPCFTVLFPARRGSEIAQWAEVKAAADEALPAAGCRRPAAGCTHHYAVGRDHRPW